MDVHNWVAEGICMAVSETANLDSVRAEFSPICGKQGTPGPDPEPEPGSCDLGGPYGLSHGTMDVSTVDGDYASVTLNVTCTKDATLTFSGESLIPLASYLLSEIKLAGKDPNGLVLNITRPGRALIFSSTLFMSGGTTPPGTFEKVYILRATIQ